MWQKAVSLVCLLMLAPVMVWPQGDTLKLPEGLSEAESRMVLKEQGAKDHVEAALKLAELKLAEANKIVQEGGYELAVKNFNLYVALVSYGDAYARRLPAAESKERSKCLKVIEQAIFKQQRPVEALRRDVPFNFREETNPLVETLKRIRLRAIDDMLGGGNMIK
jgi:hypothetical protein